LGLICLRSSNILKEGTGRFKRGGAGRGSLLLLDGGGPRRSRQRQGGMNGCQPEELEGGRRADFPSFREVLACTKSHPEK